MSLESVAGALLRSAREPEAFVPFYEKHAETLLAYLARRVFDPEVALDLMAETFAQAYAGRGRFRGSTDGQAAAWLYKIACRQLAGYRRKGGVERRALARLGIELPGLDEEQRERIEELADLDTLRGTIRVEFARLSRRQRDALELKVIEELPYAEVATRLGISEVAVRARVSRGLRAIAAALDRGHRMKEMRA